jgi:large subunit ribosomal protein L13
MQPGGLKAVVAGDMRRQFPNRLIESAVYGMLPKNRLGRKLRRKLKVYAGAEHPHQAQKPEPLQLAAAS